jgi:hypothetical protein
MGIFNSKVEPINSDYTKPGIKYETIKKEIQPLDLILFCGDDTVSHLIQRLSGRVLGPDASNYSHCGVIVTRDVLDIPALEPGKLYIFESTMSGNLTDGVKNIYNESFLGCQIRPFDEVVEAYDKPIGTKLNWCRLKDNPIKTTSILEIQQIMMECYNQYNGLLYEINLFQLFAAMIPILRCCRFNFFQNRFMFCSELAANIYKKFNLFTGNPTNVVPADFVVHDVDNEVNRDMFEIIQFHS